MNERLEEYAQLLGRIAQKTDDIEGSVREMKQIYHDQMSICRAQFVTQAEFRPIAAKVRGAVMAVILGFIGAIGTLLYQHASKFTP